MAYWTDADGALYEQDGPPENDPLEITQEQYYEAKADKKALADAALAAELASMQSSARSKAQTVYNTLSPLTTPAATRLIIARLIDPTFTP